MPCQGCTCEISFPPQVALSSVLHRAVAEQTLSLVPQARAFLKHPCGRINSALNADAVRLNTPQTCTFLTHTLPLPSCVPTAVLFLALFGDVCHWGERAAHG